ncbi:hypothetical protein Tco_0995397 [Tanacetum coccineum]
MFDRLIGEIHSFTQHPNESIVDAWLRMKNLLCSCHRHGLGRGTIIQIFYHELNEVTQAILDAGGIFLYKTLTKHTEGSDNSQSVMTSQWEVLKMKKETMPTKVIEEEVTEETTMTYDLPINPNTKTTVILDDSEDEANKAEKEVEPSSSKQAKSNLPPLKAYKPKIPYP